MIRIIFFRSSLNCFWERVRQKFKTAQYKKKIEESKSIYNFPFGNRAKKPSAKKLRAELEQLVPKLFDLREMNRQDEVKRIGEELKLLQEALQERKKNRARSIDHRLKELLGEARRFEWD